MLMVIQLLLIISLFMQITYLIFVYRAIKKMSNSIFAIIDIMQKAENKKRNELKK
jgi:hypothetical protein